MKTHVLKSLFDKDAAVKACSFIQKRLQDSCFPGEYCKSFKDNLILEHPRWLFLAF